MAGFLTPESVRQISDKLSNLGKIAEATFPGDLKPSNTPLDKLNDGAFYSRLPRSGSWEGTRGETGEKGNSTWKPDCEDVPSHANEDRNTWGDILDKYGIDGIPFKDGEPDFSEISKGTVEIDDFSTDRFGAGGNFDQADEKLAEQRGCTKEEVQSWRAEHNYTWHEKQDCKTMQKVPREVHHNVAHTGGISILKSQQSQEQA